MRSFIVFTLALLMPQLAFCAAGEAEANSLTTNTVAQPNDSAASVALFDGLCKALRDNYPMLELAGWQDSWVAELRAKVQSSPSREAALDFMDELVCRLNDYHTRLFWRGQPRLSGPPVQVEPVLAGTNLPPGYGIWGQVHPPVEMPALDGVAIAVVQAEKSCGLQAGDEIVSVDGVPVHEALARAWRHSVCSSVAGKLRSAAGRMLLGPPGSELHLEVRRAERESDNKTMTAKIARSGGLSEEAVSTKEKDGIPIIRITRWGNRRGEDLVAKVDRMLEEFRNRPGIVFDVRANGGGEDGLASEVVGRFLSHPIISSISFHRVVPGVNFERSVETTALRGPWRYPGRVAVLIDEGCMSACEHFVSGMIEAGALTCGTPTSGACGWIRPIELTDGVRVNVSQTFPLHTGGIPSPELGMAPHLWAPRTLEDLRSGRDTALQGALHWIRSTAPLPVRMQPLPPAR
jgi:C-terminal processing protease CtpA/Prc